MSGRDARATRRTVLLWAALALVPARGRAQTKLTLKEAKARGWVGEKPDGFLGLVDANAPEAAKRLVEEVNAKRLARYREIARKRGVPVEAVAVVAGETFIAKTPPGQFVMDDKGNWYRKPPE